jgi:hypothetical protein
MTCLNDNLEVGKLDDNKVLPLANVDPLIVNFANIFFPHESKQLIYKTNTAVGNTGYRWNAKLLSEKLPCHGISIWSTGILKMGKEKGNLEARRILYY